MDITLTSVSGIKEAILSLYVSKRNLTKEKEEEITDICNQCLDENGFLKQTLSCNQLGKLLTYKDKLYKYGIEYGHTTLLRFIDFSFITRDLHRGAQDDLDAHAWRMENRIIRSSTRLATFENGELSDYYKNKIMTTDEALVRKGIVLPQEIFLDEGKYVYNGHGYILEEHGHDQDVVRGLYRLSIPSNCIWKASAPALRHIFALRGPGSNAHPELQDMMDKMMTEISSKTILSDLIMSK